MTESLRWIPTWILTIILFLNIRQPLGLEYTNDLFDRFIKIAPLVALLVGVTYFYRSYTTEVDENIITLRSALLIGGILFAAIFIDAQQNIPVSFFALTVAGIWLIYWQQGELHAVNYLITAIALIAASLLLPVLAENAEDAMWGPTGAFILAAIGFLALTNHAADHWALTGS